MSDADFDSLSNALDGCFDMPLAELPAELSARIAFPWDAIEPDQRRFAAYWWDCRHNPSNEEENNASSHVAWYDSTLNAATWWSLSRITPKEAAMLLCQFDPHDEKCDPLEITNDKTGPIDYKNLLRALEGVAEQDPTPRSLIDWLSVARTRRLKHHSWAERYERAVQVLKAADLKLHQEAIIAVPPASEVPEAAPEVSDSSDDQGEREDRAQEGSADIGGRNFDVPDAFREAATTQAVAESSEQPDMEREGQTIDTSSGATTNAEGEPPKTRKDDMRLAIEEIVREIAKKGERVTAVSVMAKLKAGAGKGGCVVDVAINGDGVVWERGDGKSETMNMKTLGARLYRMRKSPR